MILPTKFDLFATVIGMSYTPRRPPARGPAKSKRTDELAAMSNSDYDEIDACKIKGMEGSLPSFLKSTCVVFVVPAG
jgi:hypothetical protein